MSAPAYELHDIGYAYGAREVLALDELRIAAERVSALVGPNGAGKSTLLKLLAFVEAPARGRIAFCGQAVAGTPLDVRRRVALVPQNAYLLRDTVFRNVEVGLRLRHVAAVERRERAEEILVELGLMRLRERPAAELSGGEKQKLAIARALVLEPEVLLLDEPFAHLDERTAAELRGLVARIGDSRTQTIVFTTHNLALAHTLAEEVHSLVGGRRHASSLLNLFHGRLDVATASFDTGRIRLPAGDTGRHGELLTVDPAGVRLHRPAPASAAQGLLEGRVAGLQESGSRVQISVEISGEMLQVLRADAELDGRGLQLGERVLVELAPGATRVL